MAIRRLDPRITSHPVCCGKLDQPNYLASCRLTPDCICIIDSRLVSFTPMLSPSVSASTPEGANLHPTTTGSSRRRALSYLRNLSQNRTSPATSPTEPPRTSPRSYFQRSISHTEPRSRSATPTANIIANSHSRRRSNSRPNEPTNPSPSSNQVTDETQGEFPTPQ